MGQGHENGEESHEQRVRRKLHAVYTLKTEERQIFMNDLIEYRKRRFNQLFTSIKTSVGPRWYQVLSEVQRRSLDNLKFSIYQDILEARPHRTAGIMKILGLYPRPNNVDLLTCVYAGRNDPKMMLAQLYLITYGYPIEAKQMSYCLNARLVLSAILYLGLNDLIRMLRERYKPEPDNTKPPPKPKRKPEPPVPSPYLQKLVACLYEKPKQQRPHPQPLPNLDDMDEPYEEPPVAPRPPPPPPPPPPPKKRLPKSYCDKLAGIEPITFTTQSNTSVLKTSSQHNKKHRHAKKTEKKTYGLGLGPPPKRRGRKKLTAPSTGLDNAQHTISGVVIIEGRPVFILGNVVILPPQGELIHGGFAYKESNVINIHGGHRGLEPPPKRLPCDCVKKWQDTAFKYLRETKCKCGHRYDYGHEGPYPQDELPYFIKPTLHSKLQFNYHHIFDLDPKHHEIEKEFNKIWETESLLRVGAKKVEEDKKKKKKRSSKTCLGTNPKEEDYLKCALRYMRNHNIAALLPDLHMVPELKEWMRRRLHGPLSRSEKSDYLRKSSIYWQMFSSLINRGFGHVSPPRDPLYSGLTNWVHKHSLNKQFKVFTEQYKLAMYRSNAYFNNLLWRSMFQAEFPDKKFREIFFSYLVGSLDYLHILCPFNLQATVDRAMTMARKRLICIPKFEPNED